MSIWRSQMMELYIETLTGTAFELRVSPFETIMSVKAKIQRLEGIPISQQHLIWQSMELEDDYCLHDYSIHDGATLKLVLAMRGGPINTRRIPMEDPALREMAEYVEANRDEIWEKLPGNKQVTLLVFREGDQLNFFRVVDRGDGTLTPLSESLSGASVYNIYDEEEEEEVPTKEKVEENEATKEKMKVLRSKMENLTVTKKPKQKKPRPPSSGRPNSHSRIRRLRSAGRSHSRNQLNSSATSSNLNSSLNGSLNKNLCLPPVGAFYSGSSSSEENLAAAAELASSVAAARDAGTSTKVETSSASARRRLESIESSAKIKRALASVQEDAGTDTSSGTRTRKETKEKLEHPRSDTMDFGVQVSPRREYTYDSLKDVGSRPITSSRKKEITLESIKESLMAPVPPSKPKERKGTSKEQYSSDFLFDAYHRPNTSSRKEYVSLDNYGRPTTSSKNPPHERRKEFTLESLSSSEARAMSGLLRQASLERLGSSRIGNFVSTSPNKQRMSGYSKEGRITTPEGRLVSARLQQKLSASQDGRLLSPTSHRLPPVKAKKKASKRCFVCMKKTGLASSYQCRCGHNFCASHRYAESHDCSFDYKTEGRKLLEQSNPVVSAPKLPKI